jgi:hypothetical protein
MTENKIIECPHMHKLKTLYVYEIGDNIELHLCECCNMNLAGEIMKQLAIQTFCPTLEEEK